MRPKRSTASAVLPLLLFGVAAHAQETQDATKLVGSWRLIKSVYGGKPYTYTGQTQIKNVTDTQFIWFRFKDGSSTIIAAGAGPYSVKGDVYSEKLDYGLGSDFKVVKGHVIPLKWRLEGNTWHTSGTLNNGLTIEEDWQRLPPQQVGP